MSAVTKPTKGKLGKKKAKRPHRDEMIRESEVKRAESKVPAAKAAPVKAPPAKTSPALSGEDHDALIFIRAREKEDPKLKPLIDSFTEDGLKVLCKLHRQFSEGGEQNLMQRYHTGKVLKKVVADAKKYQKESASKKAPVDCLAAIFAVPKSDMYTMVRMAEYWPAETDFNELVTRRTKTGGQLNFSHFKQITRIPAGTKCERLIESVFKHGWAASDVKRVIDEKGEKPGGTAGKSGRAPEVPASPSAGLKFLSSLLVKLNRRVDIYQEHVFKPIAELPKDKLDDRLLALLAEVLRNLKDAEKAVSALLALAGGTVLVVTESDELPSDEEPEAEAKPAAPKKPKARVAKDEDEDEDEDDFDADDDSHEDEESEDDDFDDDEDADEDEDEESKVDVDELEWEPDDDEDD